MAVQEIYRRQGFLVIYFIGLTAWLGKLLEELSGIKSTSTSRMDGTLQATAYRKPMGHHSDVQKTSSHPRHIKKIVTYSQAWQSTLPALITLVTPRWTTWKNAFTWQSHSIRKTDHLFEWATQTSHNYLLNTKRNPAPIACLWLLHTTAYQVDHKITACNWKRTDLEGNNPSSPTAGLQETPWSGPPHHHEQTPLWSSDSKWDCDEVQACLSFSEERRL